MTSTSLGYADFYTRNAITYTTPNVNGFVFQGQYGASNIADNSSGGSVTAWRLTYAAGPLSAQAAAQQRKSVPYSQATLSAANPGTPATTPGGAGVTTGQFLYNAAFGLISTGTTAAATAAKDALGKDTTIVGLRYKATSTVDIGVARIQNTITNTDADNTSTGTVKFFPTAGDTNATPTPLLNGGTSVGVTGIKQTSIGGGIIHTF